VVAPIPRVVSLVPSATETLLALGVVPVACTRFCEQPALPTVGGTTGKTASAGLVKKNGGSLLASPPISFACSA